MNQQLKCLLIQYLPPEIRQQIYTHTLLSHERLTDLTQLDHTCPQADQTPLLGLALSRTCRLIHNELAIKSFYTNNTFAFTRPNTAWNFFEHLRRTKQLHLLKTVSFNLRDTITIERYYETGEVVYRKGSIWMDWDHYLTCNVPSDLRGAHEITNPARRRCESDTVCVLYDDMHLTEHIPQLVGLESMVLDCVGLQRDVYERTKIKDDLLKIPLRFLRTMATSCAGLVLSTSISSGILPSPSSSDSEEEAARSRTSMRMLNRDFEIVYVGLLPERSGGDSACQMAWDEQCLRVKEAARRDLTERRMMFCRQGSAGNCEG